jgi:hypothetical protein
VSEVNLILFISCVAIVITYASKFTRAFVYIYIYIYLFIYLFTGMESVNKIKVKFLSHITCSLPSLSMKFQKLCFTNCKLYISRAIYSQNIVHIKTREHSYMFRLLPLTFFKDYQYLNT